MKNSFFVCLFAMISMMCIGWTREQNNLETTALYLISDEGEFISQGKSGVYRDGIEGHFYARSSKNNLAISYQKDVNIDETSWASRWDISICDSSAEVLKPGIYTFSSCYGSEKTAFYFNFSGDGRGGDQLGECEILEVEHNKFGKIVKFAANFIQKGCHTQPSLYGSIRFNSAVPVEQKFKDLETLYRPKISESIFYMIKYRQTPDGQTLPKIVSDLGSRSMEIKQFDSYIKGFEIQFGENSDRPWILQFLTFGSPFFIETIYENVVSGRDNNSDNVIMNIEMPDDTLLYEDGAFEVISNRLNKKKNKSLVINFRLKNLEGEIMEGALRYNSNHPINLKHPYDDFE